MSQKVADMKIDEERCIEPTSSVQPGTCTQGVIHDDVFGDMTEGGPNYRAVCKLHIQHCSAC